MPRESSGISGGSLSARLALSTVIVEFHQGWEGWIILPIPGNFKFRISGDTPGKKGCILPWSGGADRKFSRPFQQLCSLLGDRAAGKESEDLVIERGTL